MSRYHPGYCVLTVSLRTDDRLAVSSRTVTGPTGGVHPHSEYSAIVLFPKSPHSQLTSHRYTILSFGLSIALNESSVTGAFSLPDSLRLYGIHQRFISEL
ncbi:MAG: hypothetical protein H7X86_07545 [Gorillibacterium sp.]|nr:hypothetical protein [Gorillibacterium sp.]